jgi:hypothetical protein
MTVTVNWTQNDVDQLKAAIASGTLKVEYSGPPARAVTYQSLDEMRKTLAWIVAQANVGTRRTHRYVSTSKGT